MRTLIRFDPIKLPATTPFFDAIERGAQIQIERGSKSWQRTMHGSSKSRKPSAIKKNPSFLDSLIRANKSYFKRGK